MKPSDNLLTNKDVEKALVCFPTEEIYGRGEDWFFPYAFYLDNVAGHFIYTGNSTRFIHLITTLKEVTLLASYLKRDENNKIVVHKEICLGAFVPADAIFHITRYIEHGETKT